MTFQMFAHRVMEREKTAAGTHAGKDRATHSGSEENMLCGNENRSRGKHTGRRRVHHVKRHREDLIFKRKINIRG
jgi:hypothetical protein